MRAARRGDREAFAELYRAFAPALYQRVLLPRLGARAAAEEALADTFCAVLQRLGSYRDQGRSIWFWLARVAANKATDQHRRRASAGRGLAGYERLFDPGSERPESPAEALLRKDAQRDLRSRVAETLDALRPRYRRAIELRVLQERPRAECAEALEVKVGTFDVLLLRALRSFRKRWTEDGPQTEA